jgi:hypothetical protein
MCDSLYYDLYSEPRLVTKKKECAYKTRNVDKRTEKTEREQKREVFGARQGCWEMRGVWEAEEAESCGWFGILWAEQRRLTQVSEVQLSLKESPFPVNV